MSYTYFLNGVTIQSPKKLEEGKDYQKKDDGTYQINNLKNGSVFAENPSNVTLGPDTKNVKVDTPNNYKNNSVAGAPETVSGKSIFEISDELIQAKASKQVSDETSESTDNKKSVKDYPTIGHYVQAHKKEVAQGLGMDENSKLWGKDGLVEAFSKKSLALDSIYSKEGEKATKSIKTGDFTDNFVKVNFQDNTAASSDKMQSVKDTATKAGQEFSTLKQNNTPVTQDIKFMDQTPSETSKKLYGDASKAGEVYNQSLNNFTDSYLQGKDKVNLDEVITNNSTEKEKNFFSKVASLDGDSSSISKKEYAALFKYADSVNSSGSHDAGSADGQISQADMQALGNLIGDNNQTAVDNLKMFYNVPN